MKHIPFNPELRAYESVIRTGEHPLESLTTAKEIDRQNLDEKIHIKLGKKRSLLKRKFTHKRS